MIHTFSMPRLELKGRAAAAVTWAGIFLVTLAAYWPAINGGFIWDDNEHVTRPALQSLRGLWRIWFELDATQQYYPVLHSAFWVEHRLWGDAPVGYHLVNILLHATAAWLFALILQRLWVERVVPNALDRLSGGTGRTGDSPPHLNAPLFAAFLFALHPVCVESVAWISEQKNTLSTVFYLLAALAYLRFDQNRKPRTYFLASGLFVLALLSKSVTATLPAALLVIFWWQRGRLSWKRDVAPLLGWFATGAAMGLLTSWVERHYVGAEGAAYDLGLLQRCLLAGRAICFYLGKLFWPANLIFIYPHWQIDARAAWAYLFPLAVAALALALWLIRKRARGPLAALLFFAGSLFPALGFFNIFPFVYSYVADHFQYLASLGVIALFTAGAHTVFRTLRSPISSLRFLPPLLLVVLGTLTWRQAAIYRDVETLYRVTLEKNPACWMAHTNLGLALASAGRLPEAISEYEQALQFGPDHPEVIHNDLGRALLDTGRRTEAVAQFEEALRIKPGYAKPHLNLGDLFLHEHRLPEAIGQFEDDLRLDPDDSIANNNLGIALAESGRMPEAVAKFKEALRLNPHYVQAHRNLANALAQLHDRDK